LPEEHTRDVRYNEKKVIGPHRSYLARLRQGETSMLPSLLVSVELARPSLGVNVVMPNWVPDFLRR
jgi:hypothetical protein